MENSGMVLMPGGVRDLLFGEARRKRELENSMLQLFKTWGYSEVTTPTFEFYEVLAPALGEVLRDQFFRFIDERGRIMVLRPDMTTPIARLVSTRLKGESFPLRLCYVASIFRRENHAGQQREFYQVGVELIGAVGPEADAEVISLAGEALKTAGVKEFYLTVGQAGVLAGILEETNFTQEEREKAKVALSRKDFVAWEKLIANSPLPKDQREALRALPYLHGGVEVLAQVEGLVSDSRVRAGLAHLRKTWEILNDYELQDQICFDLSLLRGLGYYTGIVFEGYAPGVGYPLCGGGRYDELLSKFGFSCPATGFALGVERVLVALGKESVSRDQVPDYFIVGSNPRDVVQKAQELRRKSCTVEIEVSGRPLEQSITYATRKGIPHILVFD